jgi:hypothetical protein
MVPKPLLGPILDNDSLTRGLGDSEARLLVEWLVDQVERLAADIAPLPPSDTLVRQLCRRARSVSRFVHLWCHAGARGAACQLAATERFPWPLPTDAIDPYELMRSILAWEADREEDAASRAA